MKIKKLLALVLCIVMSLSLVACGGGETTDEPAEGEKIEIHYAYWQDTLGTYLEECKAAFEAENENITIVLEPTAWAEYWTKLETAATGGSAADEYMLLADYGSYRKASRRMEETYADATQWNRMSLHNIARSGIFAADRSIAEYADNIWHVEHR